MTTYKYKARALKHGVYSAFSNEASDDPFPAIAAPNPPTLSLLPLSESIQISLTPAVAGDAAEDFDVHFTSDGTTPTTGDAVIPNSPFTLGEFPATHATLTPGTLYKYGAVANNPAGASSISAIVSATALPDLITDLAATNEPEGGEVTWTPASPSDSSKLYYTIDDTFPDPAGNPGSTLVVDAATSPHTFGPYSPAVIIRCRAAGEASGTVGPLSTEVTMTSQTLATPAVTGNAITSTTARFSWSAIPGAVNGYTVETSVNAPGDPYQNSDATAQLFFDVDMNSGDTAYCRVQALGVTSQSSWSTEASATTLAPGNLNMVMTASRTTGTAPMVAHFTTVGTSAPGFSKPFHEIIYDIDYGDADPGTWTYGNAARAGFPQSRATDLGPNGAHVYETPGVYTATYTGKLPDGSTASATKLITVNDPDVVYAGQNTVCIAQDGVFVGAPAGCKQVTTSDAATAWAEVGADKRVLFKRGETWTWDIPQQTINVNNVQIGAWGSGAKPHLVKSDETSFVQFGVNGRSENCVVYGLELEGSGPNPTSGNSCFGGASYDHLLFFQCDIHDIEDPFGFTISLIQFWSNFSNNPSPAQGMPTVNAAVDCNCYNFGARFSSVCATNPVIMGCRGIQAATGPLDHVIRSLWFVRGVMTHNDLRSYGDDSSGVVLLKMHGPRLSEFPLVEGQWTEHMLIADNVLTAANADWNIKIGAQNDTPTEPERQRNQIIERNFFTAGYPTGAKTLSIHALVEAPDIDVRCNIFDVTDNTPATGTIGMAALKWRTLQTDVPATGSRSFNNTFVGRNENGGAQAYDAIFAEDTESSGGYVANNIFTAPNSTSTNPRVYQNSTAPGWTVANNWANGDIKTKDPGFAGAIPAHAVEWTDPSVVDLDVASGERGAGVAINGLGYDTWGRLIDPTDTTPDRGAVTYTP